MAVGRTHLVIIADARVSDKHQLIISTVSVS